MTPYLVTSGFYGERSEPFADFETALACYRFRSEERWGASLTGEGLDFDCDQDGYFCCDDGLTESEREAVEL